MPLYEYECQDCGERSEVIQGFKDRPLRKCPLCGGRVKKLVSAPAIQFKGSGWYVTDYGDKGKSKDAKPDAEASGDKGSPSKEKKTAESSKKSDGKPKKEIKSKAD